MIWNMEKMRNGENEKICVDHGNEVMYITNKGKLQKKNEFGSCGKEGMIKIWDINNGECKKCINIENNEKKVILKFLCFESRKFEEIIGFIGEDRKLKVWNETKKQIMFEYENERSVSIIEFDSKKRILFTGHSDGGLCLYFVDTKNMKDGKWEVKSIQATKHRIISIVIFDDDKMKRKIALGSLEKKIVVIEIDKIYSQSEKIKTEDKIQSLVFINFAKVFLSMEHINDRLDFLNQSKISDIKVKRKDREIGLFKSLFSVSYGDLDNKEDLVVEESNENWNISDRDILKFLFGIDRFTVKKDIETLYNLFMFFKSLKMKGKLKSLYRFIVESEFKDEFNEKYKGLLEEYSDKNSNKGTFGRRYSTRSLKYNSITNEFRHCLKYLYEKRVYWNLVLKTSDNHEVKVHKEVLAFSSTFFYYFFKQFHDEFKVKGVLNVQHFHSNELEHFLKYIYLKSVDTFDLKILLKLLIHSEKYFEIELKKVLIKKIKTILKDANCGKILEVEMIRHGNLFNSFSKPLQNVFFEFFTHELGNDNQIFFNIIRYSVKDHNEKQSILKKTKFYKHKITILQEQIKNLSREKQVIVNKDSNSSQQKMDDLEKTKSRICVIS